MLKNNTLFVHRYVITEGKLVIMTKGPGRKRDTKTVQIRRVGHQTFVNGHRVAWEC